MELNTKDINKEATNIDKSKTTAIHDSDFEMQIPIFAINRQNIKNNQDETTTIITRKNIKNFEQNIPIIIKDIYNIKVGSKLADLNYFRGVYFKSVTIYGRAYPKKILRNNAKLYTVDDGTGTVCVYCPHKKDNIKILSSINRLEYELIQSKKYGIPLVDGFTIKKQPKSSNELIKSMEIILNRIKKQTKCPDVFFPRAAKVSVVGIPYKFSRTGEMQLFAEEILEDNGENRDKELFFKTNLLRYYKNNFLNYCSDKDEDPGAEASG